MTGAFLCGDVYAVEIETKAGTLSSKLSSISEGETTVTLKGEIDARDFEALSKLPSSVKKLDLSSLKVLECSLPVADANGRSIYEAGELPAYIFFGKDLTEVSLPANLSKIPDGAFASSKVEKVTVTDGCSAIGDYSFYQCAGLKDITLPQSVRVIGDKAFVGCSNLTSISLPKGIKLVGKEIFLNSGVKQIDASGATYYGDYSLAGTGKLDNVSLNPGASYADGTLMANARVSKVEGVPSDIPALFMAGSSNVNVNDVIADADNIGEYAFAGVWLTNIILSEGINYIDEGAFANCSELIAIDANPLGSDIPEASDNAFANLNPSNIILYVTAASESQWKAHPFWSQFNIVPGESGVEEITQDGGISINTRRNVVEISAPGEIGNYAVYSVDGLHLSVGSTNESSIVLDGSEWNTNMIVVKVWNANGEKTSTFMIR